MDETKSKIKTREGSGFLRQLYSSAKTNANQTHTHFKSLTTFLVNFIPTEKIDASELQVRTHFDPSELDALSNSIKEHGVLQPILVVQDGERYKVIAGERRLRATKLAGLDRIPARVVTTDDKATHEIALRENLDRMDLHPIEEGEGYVSLLESKAYSSHEAIAKAFGKPKSRITECIGFTRLAPEIKQELMKRGLAQRAVLRELVAADPSEHQAIMERALIMGDQFVQTGAVAAATNKPGLTSKPQKPFKPFDYQCSTKAVSVPSFKWKTTDSIVQLAEYVGKLKTLVSELESKYINAPAPGLNAEPAKADQASNQSMEQSV